MISFITAVVLLILGYIFYGAFVEKVFGMNPDAKTPAITKQDGIDYVPMKPWRVFLVQFLNIAGLGPIFGAIMGIFYGPSAFLWIVFGSIFAGGVHDYLSGMMSVRRGGLSLPEIIGKELGIGVKVFLRILSMVLLLLLTASFLNGVSVLLQDICPLPDFSLGTITRPVTWMFIIFAYFAIATVLPIDKIIGKLYPIFGAVLLFMGAGVMIAMFVNHGGDIPEVFDGLQNQQTNGLPLFPMMFVSIACGAISGFHGTQSPLMARCIVSERQGRLAFYGAMICEGILALIWAAAAGTFFADPQRGVTGIQGLHEFSNSLPGENIAALVVNKICRSWLGVVGGILAIIGVVIAPITSGDTALRSARLVMADTMGLDQKKTHNRMAIALPLFLVVFGLVFVNFDSIWRYFSWTNQTMAAFTLWAGAVYLFNQVNVKKDPLSKYKNGYLIALIPALFMTVVSVSYIFIAPEGFNFAAQGLSMLAYIIAFLVAIVCLMAFYSKIFVQATTTNNQ